MSNLPMNITYVSSPTPNSPPFLIGKTLTQNQVCGAPIKYIRENIDDLASGVIINNKISNVATLRGDDNCRRVVEKVKSTFSIDHVIPASTGVIGWDLPVSEMEGAIESLPPSPPCTPLSFASSIMTTDRWPKLHTVPLGSCSTMFGTAKGAGMIEPNMGTMLCYVLTDAKPPRGALQGITERVAERTFNCVSVDGDESTSDMFVVLCNPEGEAVGEEEFEGKLGEVCEVLAKGIVRNGEGTGHVIRVEVRNYPGSDQEAR